MIPVTTFSGKMVAVFGLGASGIATVHALLAGGAEVEAWDDSEASRAAAEKAGVPLVNLREADWSRFAALVLAPGVPLTHPEPHWTVKAAKAAGVEVIGDIELFCRERRLQPFEVPFIAITGTNGKSTTTALTAHILKTTGLDVQMGGNIGTPVLALEPFAPARHYVLECSSFQIELAPSLDPSVGVLLNITPDHLDRHGTMENYAAIKERLVAGATGKAAVGLDDAPSRQIFARQISRLGASHEGRIVGISGKPSPADKGKLKKIAFGAHGLSGFYVVRSEDVYVDTSAPSLRGAHNRQNLTAAFAAAHEGLIEAARRQSGDGSAHVDSAVARMFEAGARTFPGLPHRMEEIGRLGRVLFINDSKATNADSADKALLSWERDIYWIAGGRAKEGGIASLAPLFPRIARAYLIGEAAEAFAQTLDGQVPFELCNTLDRAVEAAARDAAARAGEEPVVLLSPACASYDQFKNFEERGEAFRRLVLALPGVGSDPSRITSRSATRGTREGSDPIDDPTSGSGTAS